eukprot:GHVT01030568.1.p1 GENE.GHVT01030568.1~~GHVT01030568.1.p1  ORF type:complete len:298 (-),score=26.15 GHVT01030568.1:2033-2926(-)
MAAPAATVPPPTSCVSASSVMVWGSNRRRSALQMMSNSRHETNPCSPGASPAPLPHTCTAAGMRSRSCSKHEIRHRPGRIRRADVIIKSVPSLGQKWDVYHTVGGGGETITTAGTAPIKTKARRRKRRGRARRLLDPVGRHKQTLSYIIETYQILYYYHLLLDSFLLSASIRHNLSRIVFLRLHRHPLPPPFPTSTLHPFIFLTPLPILMFSQVIVVDYCKLDTKNTSKIVWPHTLTRPSSSPPSSSPASFSSSFFFLSFSLVSLVSFLFFVFFLPVFLFPVFLFFFFFIFFSFQYP